MYTQVKWNISLNDKREGAHELEIKIFEYDPSDKPFAQFIALPPELNIANFQSEANNTAIYWAGDKTIEISEIAKAYQNILPNHLTVHCQFDTEEITSNYDDFTVLTFYHIVSDLKASSIEILINMPKVSCLIFKIEYYLLKILSIPGLTKLFGIKNIQDIVGVYKIKEAKGAEVQRWEVSESGPKHTLKFKIPEGAVKSSINFSYIRAAKPIWYFIGGIASIYAVHRVLRVLFG